VLPSGAELAQDFPPVPPDGLTTSPGAFVGFFGFMVIACVVMLVLHRRYYTWRSPSRTLPRARLRRRRG
jgi:hypothetical protein